jgi:hypothetical protein
MVLNTVIVIPSKFWHVYHMNKNLPVNPEWGDPNSNRAFIS